MFKAGSYEPAQFFISVKWLKKWIYQLNLYLEVMEEQGYIEIRVSSKAYLLTPKDVDISDVKELITNVEAFLYPDRKEKTNRPQISYNIEEGSARHKFFLPITAVILFNGLTQEITKRRSLDFLDNKRQVIIDNFQKRAKREGIKMEFNSSMAQESTLIIDKSTNFEMIAPRYFESEFYLYGEIYQEGGKNPKLHMSTHQYGNITVSATKKQIVSGEKKTYKPYGIKVKGKKNLRDNSLSDLILLEFIQYKPVFDASLLDKVIDKASDNLSRITDVDTWLNDIKAEGV